MMTDGKSDTIGDLPKWASDDLSLPELRAMLDLWTDRYGNRDVAEDELRELVADAKEEVRK